MRSRVVLGVVLPTNYCFRFVATFQEALAAFNKSEGSRIARLAVLKFTSRLVGTESALSHFRLEKAIADSKPTPVNIDPTTRFWTVYKEVADEHDSDMVAKYAGDLDTSLLFVSTFAPFACIVLIQLGPFLVLGGFVLCRSHHVHCPNHPIAPTKPYRCHEPPPASNTAA